MHLLIFDSPSITFQFITDVLGDNSSLTDKIEKTIYLKQQRTNFRID